ncbi:Uncharacterized protein SCF082_LOCUS2093 [Durusdinium trenchii]|uniref:F5/8 type C domain-containing protein n=1 Tax=Durusdinium trenchii TaxID=1381693 RepID=A0ABP0HJZ0_9DINO
MFDRRERIWFLVGTCLTWFVAAEFGLQTASAESSFEQKVAPLFAKHCVSCHNEEDRKGGLSLTSRAALAKGGESGEVVIPHEPNASYLLDLIEPYDGKAEMPKGGSPLSQAERQILRDWIAEGAPWPKDVVVEAEAWWSLASLQQPTVPVLPDHSQGKVEFIIRNPIDAFILRTLNRQELSPSPAADRATLIRRLSFDLVGLPPTPEEVEAFVHDPDPLAYERLVDRLLASPQYGERWARHWLDIVHYGETHGYDKDKPRPHAWPYRDYVIRSLNEDKPYGQFIREQVAGDVLAEGTVDGIEALGFLAAGPWDYISHVEVPETKIDGKIARHLDRDDMVQTTMMSFCSLTVGCAQCHDHKFDPIPQEDYYRLHAVFAALDRADKEYDVDPSVSRRREELLAEQRRYDDRLKTVERRIAEAAGPKLAKLNQQLAELRKAKGDRPPQYGYHSQIMQTADNVKWVQVDLGSSQPLSRIEYIGCHDDFNGIGAGFGFPPAYRIDVSDDPAFETGVRTVFAVEGNVPNPGTAPQEVSLEGVTGRYVRFTATRLAPRRNDYIFALAELLVFDEQNENIARGRPVTALDSIEAPIRWGRANLVDGIAPGRSGREAEIASLEQQRTELLTDRVESSLLAERDQVRAGLALIRQGIRLLPTPRKVYAGTVHHGGGNFRGTGPDGGRPRPIHILPRGDVRSPGREVQPGTLSCLTSLESRFVIAPEAPEEDRRAALARWLSDHRNPLVWRSIANRVWQYHFGRGLVATPNDFGRMGELPTHPDLLDWLAVKLRDGGESLKELHRLIVLSSTYRQSSVGNPHAAEIDAGNRFLWRMNRRRLEAEAVRDSLLFVSGRLNPEMGGKSFQDFVIEKPQHSPHYQYHLHDPNDPRAHRRAVYRFLVRSKTQPFMTVMDCADPSMQVPQRNETNSPLQALAMLNNKLALAMARNFAEEVSSRETGVEGQVRLAVRMALSRPPTDEEAAQLVAYTKQHGLENTCRVLFNLNEFMYVD